MKILKQFPLSGTNNGQISVGIIDKPYGDDSDSVASIAISLNADNKEPDWKVHIPKENIGEVIDALKSAKEEL